MPEWLKLALDLDALKACHKTLHDVAFGEYESFSPDWKVLIEARMIVEREIGYLEEDDEEND